MNQSTLMIKDEAYSLDSVKHAFLIYMTTLNPKVKTKTLQTYCSDAFFIYEQLPIRWLEGIVDNSDTTDADLKEHLYVLIRNDITATRQFPDKDARSYLRRFWQLVEFLRMICVLEEGHLALPRRIGD